MRRLTLFVFCFLAVQCSGCHKRSSSEFHFKPGLTAQDFEDQLGSPTRVAANWVGYTLNDGNEMRIYFLEGPKGTVRTLTQADLYTPAGVRISEFFNLKELKAATEPTTTPATNPITVPSTTPTTAP